MKRQQWLFKSLITIITFYNIKIVILKTEKKIKGEDDHSIIKLNRNWEIYINFVVKSFNIYYSRLLNNIQYQWSNILRSDCLTLVIFTRSLRLTQGWAGSSQLILGSTRKVKKVGARLMVRTWKPHHLMAKMKPCALPIIFHCYIWYLMRQHNFLLLQKEKKIIKDGA